jgi:hypothetical protein
LARDFPPVVRAVLAVLESDPQADGLAS